MTCRSLCDIQSTSLSTCELMVCTARMWMHASLCAGVCWCLLVPCRATAQAVAPTLMMISWTQRQQQLGRGATAPHNRRQHTRKPRLLRPSSLPSMADTPLQGPRGLLEALVLLGGL
jgi:hypothetical protein